MEPPSRSGQTGNTVSSIHHRSADEFLSASCLDVSAGIPDWFVLVRGSLVDIARIPGRSATLEATVLLPVESEEK